MGGLCAAETAQAADQLRLLNFSDINAEWNQRDLLQ